MPQTDKNLITNEVLICLETLLKDLGITNHTLEISPGSECGENYSGIVAKVKIVGQDKSNKTTCLNLIVKTAVCNEKYRLIVPIRQAFGREIYIYKVVLPEFLQFQSEKHVSDPFKSVAKFYTSTMEYLNESVIMENMKQYGFCSYKRRCDALDYNHVAIGMREYGKFHAISFALRDQKAQIFEDFSRNTLDAFFTGKNGEKFFEAVLPQSNRALGALHQNDDGEVYEKFVTFQKNIKELVLEVLKPEMAGKYAVINHGDCWVNNMLFKYSDPEKPHVPTEMCLLDWQLARSGSPALDLSYFIFTCTDKELRDKHYDQLIKEYYKSLCNNLRELGSDPDILFPYNILQEHLKKFSVYGLFMTIIVLYMMTSDVDEIPDIHNVSDVEDVTELLKYESKNVEKYNSRIRGVILDYVRFGYDL